MFKSAEEVIKYITEIIPYYVPEWKFDSESKELGSIFAFAFARMMEINYTQFEKILDKHYISFLNCLSIPPLPQRPVPATGFLVVELADNAPKGEYITKNTVVYNDENIPYLIQQDAYISNAKLKEVYCINKYVVYDAFDKENNSLKLFDNSITAKLPKLYIGHEKVFDNLDSDSKIMLSFGEDKSFLADINKYEWTYSGKNYTKFKNVVWEEEKLSLTLDNRFLFEPDIVDDISSFFICCSPTKVENDLEFQISKVLVSCLVTETSAEHLFHGDIEILDKDYFEPFGKTLISRDNLYIGCKKVFSNKGAKIKITFQIHFSYYKKIINEPVLFFSLDYWNGNGFVTLPILGEKTITDLFNSSLPISVSFICPDDIDVLLLNGLENIWIRIRLIDINRNIIPVSNDNFEDISLFFANLKLSYVYDEPIEPSQIIIENNNEFKHIKKLHNLSVFSNFKEFFPAIYFGFDHNFIGNPICLLFEMLQENIIYNGQSGFLFYEYTSDRWNKIQFIDETHGFQKTGIITLFASSKMNKTNFFGKEQYWIKMVASQTDIYKIFVSKVYMNVVKIIQKTLPIEENYLYMGESQYNLKQKNILSVEVEVDGDSFIDFEISAQEGIIKLNNEKLIKTYKNNTSIIIRYCVSEGKNGNCKEDTITVFPLSTNSIKKIYNPLPLEDGLSFETNEEQILRGTKKLRHRGYAVTFLDFEMLALESSYVIKCKCYGNTNKLWEKKAGYAVIVYLPVNYKNKGSFSIEDKIKQYILERTLPIFAIDDRLTFYEAVYININLSFEIKVDEKESFIFYREKLVEMLKNFFNPFTGNFNNKGYDIGWIPDADFVLHYLYTLDFVKIINNYLFVIDEFESKKWYALPCLNQIVISEIR